MSTLSPHRRVSPLLWILLVGAFFLGSMVDEAAEVAFALAVTGPDASSGAAVSILLAVALVGGVVAAPIAPYLFRRLPALRVVGSAGAECAAYFLGGGLVSTDNAALGVLVLGGFTLLVGLGGTAWNLARKEKP